MRSYVPTKWYDLGLELLDQEDEQELNVIESDKHGDSEKSTTDMFKLWLSRKPSANWNDIVQALTDIKMNDLATKIKEMILPEGIVCVCVCACVRACMRVSVHVPTPKYIHILEYLLQQYNTFKEISILLHIAIYCDILQYILQCLLS